MKSKRYPVGTGGGRHPERAEQKREEAAARAAAWHGLGPKKQLAALDNRLGVDVGAKRQRARIARAS